MSDGETEQRGSPQEIGSIPASERAPWQQSGRLKNRLYWLFGFQAEVKPGDYARIGMVLMLLKYAVEAGVLLLATGLLLTPLEFLIPSMIFRERILAGMPESLGWLWFLWTLPFMWIAVSLSVRRSVNAGGSPWFGLMVLVPVFNLIAMVVLACCPERRWGTIRGELPVEPALAQIQSALIGIMAGGLLAVGMVFVGIYLFRDYGGSVFLGTPVMVGVISSLIYNRQVPRSALASMFLGVLSVAICGLMLIAFALEGAICILMAAPLALPLGALGGFVGKIIATTARRPVRGAVTAIALLPGWAGVESVSHPVREFQIMTAVEIDAPIQNVWDTIIAFPDITAPPPWYFHLGIACPIRGRIDGHGPGAVRHCEFTTGTFVEPITVWDEPHRLAFDVAEQPHALRELSPYRHVHPPHLEGYLESTHGEFVLQELPGNRTRVEGRTWYHFEMYPQQYWTLWSDLMIHRIHERVLNHVKQHAEHHSSLDVNE